MSDHSSRGACLPPQAADVLNNATKAPTAGMGRFESKMRLLAFVPALRSALRAVLPHARPSVARLIQALARSQFNVTTATARLRGDPALLAQHRATKLSLQARRTCRTWGHGRAV